MWGAKRVFRGYKQSGLFAVGALALVVTGLTGVPAVAQQKGQKTFASPEEASKALYAAANNSDERGLLEIFGPTGKKLVTSGDPAQDAEDRANFAKHSEEMNRLVKEPDGTVTLYIGARNWPYPIPLVNKGTIWYFDTAAGEKEIVFRRIGRNELSAIHICQQLVAAQKEYFAEHNQYAQKIFSEKGKRDGLYWAAKENEPQSPIGPRLAWAFASDPATKQGGEFAPFRGYLFEMLSGQGKDAGSGFMFVAYPAEYRSSGVKTFLVGTDGIIYEKDLGKKTNALVKSMKYSNPDSTWQKAEVEQQPTDGESTK